MPEYKYGALIGRFQPFHLGHELIVREIVADGLIPLIIIGSAQESRTAKNPYKANERFGMIRESLGWLHNNFRSEDIKDDNDWDKWRDKFDVIVGKYKPLIYYHHKEQDRLSFTYKGKLHQNTFWTKCLEDTYELKEATFPSKAGITVSASDIRKDLEGHKHFLCPTIYQSLKGRKHATKEKA